MPSKSNSNHKFLTTKRLSYHFIIMIILIVFFIVTIVRIIGIIMTMIIIIVIVVSVKPPAVDVLASST